MFPEIACALAAMALALGPAQTLRPYEGPAHVTARADAAGAHRLFGGRTVTLPVLVHAPDPDSVDLRAVLVQLTSSLSMPVADELDVRLSGDTAAGPWLDAGVSLTPPEVKRESDFEIRFRSRRHGESTWQPAGRLTVRIYPSDLLEPVREWARSHPISVQDDRGRLVEFLRRQRIRIADQTGGGGVTLHVGSRGKDEGRFLLHGRAAILFHERETDTPYLLVERTGPGIVMTVEARFLDRLETDPQAQKLLLEVFRRLHEQLALMEGVDR